MVYLKENYTFQRFLRGPNIFHGRPPFSKGAQMLLSIEIYRICDFPGGRI